MIQKGFRRFVGAKAKQQVHSGVCVLVPQPPSNRNKMKSVGRLLSPAISKEMHCGTNLPISNQRGAGRPSGRSVLCRVFKQEQKGNHSINRDTFSSWHRRPVKLPDYLITNDNDTHWVPQPPNGTLEVKPVGRKFISPTARQKDCGKTIGSQQPKMVPGGNQNGVGGPHAPFQRVFCKHYKEEQKDVPSLHQDTYSSWCRKLSTMRKRDDDIVSAIKSIYRKDRGSISIRWKTFSKLPHKMPSEEDSICGEEKTDEVRNVFAEDLERIRKPLKDVELDALRRDWERYYERTKQLPTILQIFADDFKDLAQDEDIFSLAFEKMQHTMYGAGGKNIPKYQEDIEAHPKLDRGDTAYEPFSRHFAQGCWDLWCLRKYTSDLAACGSHEHHKTCNAEEESVTDGARLLNKLQKRQTYLHDALKSYAAAREKAQRRDQFFSDISEMLTECEYQKLQKIHTSHVFTMYKDLLLELMLPEWQKKFDLNPEDLFYFKYPQDLLDWLSCMGMSDLAEVTRDYASYGLDPASYENVRGPNTCKEMTLTGWNL